MDDRVMKKLILPSIIITILSTVFIYELKNLTNVLLFKKKHALVIGILSAPENFDKRLSLRKTWLQLLPEISASYYFIIGNEICEIPPFDKFNPYSCIGLPYILPTNATVDTEFTTIKIHPSELEGDIFDFTGFGFYVREKIVVKKIGILKNFVQAANTEIQVQLISAIDNNILASITFSPEIVDEASSKVLTKTIDNVILKNSSEVFLKITTNNFKRKFYPSCSFTTWEFEPNILHFTQLWEEDRVIQQPFTDKSCSFVFLTYTILEVENIKQHVRNKKIRQREWGKYNKNLSLDLKNESQTYNDLLLVDVIDVYRNLSKKMIQFYKKVAQIENFNYILKADDDSFIDLLRVYDQLQLVRKKTQRELTYINDAYSKQPKFWLWSNFKEYWKVQRTGKWREDSYQSASYPTFPCGGGYVINKEIVEYIIANEENLHSFQGEDVSLGIWLSALPVKQHKSLKKIPNNGYNIQKLIRNKFGKDLKQINDLKPDLCLWTCNNKRKYGLPLCNKVELNVQDMYKTWTNFVVNGFL